MLTYKYNVVKRIRNGVAKFLERQAAFFTFFQEGYAGRILPLEPGYAVANWVR
jgi:hypothetical protein